MSLPILLLLAAPAELPPNELGKIPILEYHRVEDPEGRWTRTPANLERDLEDLYARGYFLTNLSELLDRRISAPAGRTPVVLTFDDSAPGQVWFLPDHTLDPHCALAVLEAFRKRHPDGGHGATFFVLPAADPPNRLFNQPGLEKEKLELLTRLGYEIGNHTLWHADLAKYGEDTVREQLGDAELWIGRYLPGYRLRALSLPYGDYPKDLTWLTDGRGKYKLEAALKVAGGPAPSPFAASFSAFHLPRIQATGGPLATILAALEQHPEERFVSDGDPAIVTVPKALRPRLGALPKGLTVSER